MEIMCLKAPNGALVPLDDEQADKMRRLKGPVLRCEIATMRNGAFFRKWFALAKFAFDLWEDDREPMQYRGQAVQATFDRFRKDLIILAGYFDPVFDIQGNMKVQARSIAWANMSEEEFEHLYSKTIDAILAKVLPRHGLNRQAIDAHVDRVLEFA